MIFAMLLALASPQRDYTTSGNGLLATCEDEAAFSKGLCYGFIDGFISGFEAGRLDASYKVFCRPERVTNKQKVDVVLEYLRRHPENRQDRSELLMLTALKEAWPCKK